MADVNEPRYDGVLVQRSSSIVSNASSSSTAPKHTYHGHRRNSFTTTDVEELTELRARQRTHNGAYERTALGTSVYAIVLLKIFSPAFARSAFACSLVPLGTESSGATAS